MLLLELLMLDENWIVGLAELGEVLLLLVGGLWAELRRVVLVEVHHHVSEVGGVAVALLGCGHCHSGLTSVD